NVESDQIHIVAMANAFGVPVRVEDLDLSESDEVNHHDITPMEPALADALGNSVVPSVELLYRPGHYDVKPPNFATTIAMAGSPTNEAGSAAPPPLPDKDDADVDDGSAPASPTRPPPAPISSGHLRLAGVLGVSHKRWAVLGKGDDDKFDIDSLFVIQKREFRKAEPPSSPANSALLADLAASAVSLRGLLILYKSDTSAATYESPLAIFNLRTLAKIEPNGAHFTLTSTAPYASATPLHFTAVSPELAARWVASIKAAAEDVKDHTYDAENDEAYAAAYAALVDAVSKPKTAAPPHPAETVTAAADLVEETVVPETASGPSKDVDVDVPILPPKDDLESEEAKAKATRIPLPASFRISGLFRRRGSSPAPPHAPAAAAPSVEVTDAAVDEQEAPEASAPAAQPDAETPGDSPSDAPTKPQSSLFKLPTTLFRRSPAPNPPASQPQSPTAQSPSTEKAAEAAETDAADTGAEAVAQVSTEEVTEKPTSPQTNAPGIFRFPTLFRRPSGAPVGTAKDVPPADENENEAPLPPPPSGEDSAEISAPTESAQAAEEPKSPPAAQPALFRGFATLFRRSSLPSTTRSSADIAPKGKEREVVETEDGEDVPPPVLPKDDVDLGEPVPPKHDRRRALTLPRFAGLRKALSGGDIAKAASVQEDKTKDAAPTDVEAKVEEDGEGEAPTSPPVVPKDGDVDADAVAQPQPPRDRAEWRRAFTLPRIPALLRGTSRTRGEKAAADESEAAETAEAAAPVVDGEKKVEEEKEAADGGEPDKDYVAPAPAPQERRRTFTLPRLTGLRKSASKPDVAASAAAASDKDVEAAEEADTAAATASSSATPTSPRGAKLFAPFRPLASALAGALPRLQHGPPPVPPKDEPTAAAVEDSKDAATEAEPPADVVVPAAV
ncbi:hypothetical protein HK405_010000, partial [Cladochytrium tenue]